MRTKIVTVKLQHRSSIWGARWCLPVGWEPTNEIDGSEFLDGSYWDDTEETAGVIGFVDGDEGEPQTNDTWNRPPAKEPVGPDA